ncbi:MAG: hypothetical protein CL510_09520 [Actinobacteria bacterium]|uniref:Uncharacterized protein n=1 Tax=Erythrobacter aureus TaxID=2182384 RepID=A0A345YBH1_9SPHN|nr:hypothetical protein DVR09_02080 [Erythrobacter aureus]MBQ96047.1 hypothetical protein [Actinomycetota bacterium]
MSRSKVPCVLTVLFRAKYFDDCLVQGVAAASNAFALHLCQMLLGVVDRKTHCCIVKVPAIDGIDCHHVQYTEIIIAGSAKSAGRLSFLFCDQF